MRPALIAAALGFLAASLCCGGLRGGPGAESVPVESAGVAVPQPAAAPGGAVFRGHTITLADPSFLLRSADGGVMLGVGTVETVAWDGATGAELWRHPGPVASADLSADGSSAVLLGEDASTLRLLDARTGAERARFTASAEAWDATLTPRGSHVVVVGYGGLTVYDPAGEAVSSITSEWTLLESPRVSPDGATLYYSDEGHEVAWDLAAGRERGRFGDGSAEVFRVGADGSVWAFLEDGPPHRYDAASLESRGAVPCSDEDYWDIGWMMDLSPSGRWLLLGGEVVDPATCERLVYLTGDDVIDGLFGPGEATVWSAGPHRVEQWELVGEQAVWALGEARVDPAGEEVIAATAITADGAHVAEVRHGGQVTLWHAGDKAPRWTATVPGCPGEMDCEVDRAGVHGDEVWVALDGGAVGLFALADGAARVLQLADGLMAVDRTADGRWVSTDYQDVLRVRTAAGAEVSGQSWEVESCDEVAVSPDGRWIAVESGDELVVLDSTTGERRVLADLSDTFVLHMDLSSRGVLAVVDFEDRVTAWDVVAGSRLWERTDLTAPDSARFTADGATVVVATLALRVLDAATGAERLSVVSPADYSFDAFDLTPDGRRVAAVKQWDTGDTLWVVDLGRLQ